MAKAASSSVAPRAIARRLPKRLAELAEISETFDRDVRYTERVVTDRLAVRFTDPIFVRRLLIEHGFLARTADGSAYWRIDV